MDYKRLLGALLSIAVFIFILLCFIVRKAPSFSNIDKNDELISEQEVVDADTTEPALIRYSDVAFDHSVNDKSEELQDDYVTQRVQTDKATVYILASSVYKDIKVKLLDENGQRITGIAWRLNISDAEDNKWSYSDNDLDGIVHIDGLLAGEYYICLEDEPGYIVPADSVRVHVKNVITYAEIPSILDELKTEDEIDPLVDDAYLVEDAEEEDKGILDITTAEGVYGIDVSKYNKDIDWELVRASGVRYAIIRCGYRGYTSGQLVLDPYFEKNMDEARAAGVEVGVYFFTQAISLTEAIEEASVVCALLKDKDIQYPVFVDVEGSGGRADIIDSDQRGQFISAFVNTVKAQGYRAGLYANKNWLTNRINTGLLPDDTIIWLAQYNVTGPTYNGPYHMWQYTSKGSVPGIEGYVDLDQSYLRIGE